MTPRMTEAEIQVYEQATKAGAADMLRSGWTGDEIAEYLAERTRIARAARSELVTS